MFCDLVNESNWITKRFQLTNISCYPQLPCLRQQASRASAPGSVGDPFL